MAYPAVYVTNEGVLSARADLLDLTPEIETLEVGLAIAGSVEVDPYKCHLNKRAES
jgi:hypothetical protein